jgi:phosphate transport system permease protein
MAMAEQMTSTKSTGAEEASRISAAVHAGLKARYRSETRFKLYGIGAISFALLMLLVLFTTIIGNGYTAFLQSEMTLEVHITADELDIGDARDIDTLKAANYQGQIKAALRTAFPQATTRREKRELYGIISDAATYDLRDKVLADPSLIGQTISLSAPMAAEMDMMAKGIIDRDAVEHERKVSDFEISLYDQLQANGNVSMALNTALFTNGDSRQPELAGIWGAAVGSFFTLAVTLALSFPIGVSAAVYLEEFAPKNRWTDLIEVNINNLAAVPSIVFGLLGLAVFLQFFGMPRSAPVAGGLVLTLMTLPTIIIASRAALKSVPPSIREAALGLGASKLQMITHHVLPLAMPGMLTGTIIGMAQALGESAPLLMIGMVAFVVDIPGSPMDPSTVLPVQIYLWADSPERAFVERTSAAIMVLLAFLVFMNAAAVMLRKKFERRW